jgi:hypothetical protein
MSAGDPNTPVLIVWHESVLGQAAEAEKLLARFRQQVEDVLDKQESAVRVIVAAEQDQAVLPDDRYVSTRLEAVAERLGQAQVGFVIGPREWAHAVREASPRPADVYVTPFEPSTDPSQVASGGLAFIKTLEHVEGLAENRRPPGPELGGLPRHELADPSAFLVRIETPELRTRILDFQRTRKTHRWQAFRDIGHLVRYASAVPATFLLEQGWEFHYTMGVAAQDSYKQETLPHGGVEEHAGKRRRTAARAAGQVGSAAADSTHQRT